MTSIKELSYAGRSTLGRSDDQRGQPRSPSLVDSLSQPSPLQRAILNSTAERRQIDRILKFQGSVA